MYKSVFLCVFDYLEIIFTCCTQFFIMLSVLEHTFCFSLKAGYYKLWIKVASYYMGNNIRLTTVVHAKSLLSVSQCYCVQFISSENTNISSTLNFIQLEKVGQVQLDREGEPWRCLKSQMNLQRVCCPYMDTD